MSFALSDIINKRSTKLRSATVESTGSLGNAMYLYKHPEQKETLLLYYNQHSYWIGQQAKPPFPEPFDDVQCIMAVVNNPETIVTLDPDIKTLEDLAGKNIAAGPKTASTWYIPTMIYDYLGLLDEINWSAMSFGAATAAVLSGTADAALMAFGVTGGNEVTGIPPTEQCFRTKRTYIISIPKDVADGTQEKSGMFMGFGNFHIGDRGKTPAQDFSAVVTYNSWWCHPDMPDETVREICNIVYDNIDEFGNYHVLGKAMTKENRGAVLIPDEMFHPEAIKFFKEKGIKYGFASQ